MRSERGERPSDLGVAGTGADSYSRFAGDIAAELARGIKQAAVALKDVFRRFSGAPARDG